MKLTSHAWRMYEMQVLNKGRGLMIFSLYMCVCVCVTRVMSGGNGPVTVQYNSFGVYWR
jgi:hypothetical protein